MCPQRVEGRLGRPAMAAARSVVGVVVDRSKDEAEGITSCLRCVERLNGARHHLGLGRPEKRLNNIPRERVLF